jgi:protein-serine/threonine kinase
MTNICVQYAMLAGYLPFDDDPANPEGDNINLLYKYIVNTPLTFPEYVTPHARDLLRRILVPNPRKRADLFEVARHSWLSEYANVVERVTSSTTTPRDIQNTTVPSEEAESHIARSASVREATKKNVGSPTLGGLATKQGTIDQDADLVNRGQKDAKRRTVQVEYVAPTTQTQRGETVAGPSGKTRARSGSQGPVEVDKPLPRDPPVARDAYGKAAVQGRLPPSASRSQAAQPRPSQARATSDTVYLSNSGGAGGRPETGGSMQSTGSRPARAPYGQPLPPEVAEANAQGRIQQPSSSGRPYGTPGSQEGQGVDDYGRPSIGVSPKFARLSGFNNEDADGAEVKGHKRSSTLGSIGGKIFGRSGSIFGGRSRKRSEQQQAQGQQPGEKSRKYPPISMTNHMAAGEDGRVSMDSKRSRRSFSFGLGRKKSGSIAGSQTSQEKQNRRFSLIPQSFSRAIGGGGRDYDGGTAETQDLPIQQPPEVDRYGQYIDQSMTRAPVDAATVDDMYAQLQDSRQQASQRATGNQPSSYNQAQHDGRPSAIPSYIQPGGVLVTGSDSSLDHPNRRAPNAAPYQQQGSPDISGYDSRRVANSRGNRTVLQKNKRFVDAYDTDEYSHPHNYSGSSGPARRVMDFFRRRGKARGGEEG